MEKYTTKENYITSNPEPEYWRRHTNGKILEFHKDVIQGSVLDFGCNHGACSFLLLENEKVKNVLGLDLNCQSLVVANETKSKYFPDEPIEFLCKNILDFKPQLRFDTIISFHTLEHIYPEDMDTTLKRLFDSLNYDGYFVVSLPYEHAYDDGVQHVSFFNETSLKEVFEKNGFVTIECFKDNRGVDPNILTGIFKKIR